MCSLEASEGEPVGHGEVVAGTLGHLHPAGRHPDVWLWGILQCRLHSYRL